MTEDSDLLSEKDGTLKRFRERKSWRGDVVGGVGKEKNKKRNS